jgi:hypothetical protein
MKQRLANFSKLKPKIIASAPGTLSACFDLEQSFIEEYDGKRLCDIGPEILDGFSEVFELNEKEIKKAMKRIQEMKKYQ